MKKTALTLVALAFGSCVAFAQTTPQTEEPAVNTEESVATDKMSNTEAEAGLRAVEVDQLPAAVQESLGGEAFKTYKVVAAAEVQGQEGAQAGKFYQVALAEGEATEPSLIVLFNEEGEAVAQEEATPEKQEN
jgi:hypothetical protein